VLELVTHLPAVLSAALVTHPGSLSALAAGPVQNPGPADPTNGSNGVTLLIAYAKWGALIACAGATWCGRSWADVLHWLVSQVLVLRCG
jgi:hypothetical protein